MAALLPYTSVSSPFAAVKGPSLFSSPSALTKSSTIVTTTPTPPTTSNVPPALTTTASLPNSPPRPTPSSPSCNALRRSAPLRAAGYDFPPPLHRLLRQPRRVPAPLSVALAPQVLATGDGRTHLPYMLRVVLKAYSRRKDEFSGAEACTQRWREHRSR